MPKAYPFARQIRHLDDARRMVLSPPSWQGGWAAGSGGSAQCAGACGYARAGPVVGASTFLDLRSVYATAWQVTNMEEHKATDVLIHHVATALNVPTASRA
jgi:hypothetical protein